MAGRQIPIDAATAPIRGALARYREQPSAAHAVQQRLPAFPAHTVPSFSSAAAGGGALSAGEHPASTTTAAAAAAVAKPPEIEEVMRHMNDMRAGIASTTTQFAESVRGISSEMPPGSKAYLPGWFQPPQSTTDLAGMNSATGGGAGGGGGGRLDAPWNMADRADEKSFDRNPLSYSIPTFAPPPPPPPTSAAGGAGGAAFPMPVNGAFSAAATAAPFSLPPFALRRDRGADHDAAIRDLTARLTAQTNAGNAQLDQSQRFGMLTSGLQNTAKTVEMFKAAAANPNGPAAASLAAATSGFANAANAIPNANGNVTITPAMQDKLTEKMMEIVALRDKLKPFGELTAQATRDLRRAFGADEWMGRHGAEQMSVPVSDLIGPMERAWMNRRQADESWRAARGRIWWRSGRDAIGQSAGPMNSVTTGSTAPTAAAAATGATGATAAAATATGASTAPSKPGGAAGTSAPNEPTVATPLPFEWNCVTVDSKGRVICGGQRLSGSVPPIWEPIVCAFQFVTSAPSSDPKPDVQAVELTTTTTTTTQPLNPGSLVTSPEWKTFNGCNMALPDLAVSSRVVQLATMSTPTVQASTPNSNSSASASATMTEYVYGLLNLAPTPFTANRAASSTTQYDANLMVQQTCPTCMLVRLAMDGTHDASFSSTGLSSCLDTTGSVGAALQVRTENQLVVVLVRQRTAGLVVVLDANGRFRCKAALAVDTIMTTSLAISSEADVDGSLQIVAGGSQTTDWYSLKSRGFLQIFTLVEGGGVNDTLELEPVAFQFGDDTASSSSNAARTELLLHVDTIGTLQPSDGSSANIPLQLIMEESAMTTCVVAIVEDKKRACWWVVAQQWGIRQTDYADVSIFKLQLNADPLLQPVGVFVHSEGSQLNTVMLRRAILAGDQASLLMVGLLRRVSFQPLSNQMMLLRFDLITHQFSFHELPVQADGPSTGTSVCTFPPTRGHIATFQFQTGSAPHSVQAGIAHQWNA